MGKNLVNLTVNPCKMCMPMGVVSAFYGIRKCMTILHGSQGCSTYIRRHMATHYNEPIDIASSSLTEEGTVYGGEKNLIKGLENLIKLYNPEVIGVATTCLAETIGEDVPRIIENFYKKNPGCNVKIINVASAGYAGTQYEGFFKTLRAIVESVKMDVTKNDRVNIITPLISPADTRFLKSLLDSFGIDYILLPDISENLDGEYVKKYDKLPKGGTKLEDISRMGGASFTIELSEFSDEENSVARYLCEKYGVQYVKLPLPIGIKNTDALINQLEQITERKALNNIKQQRGRYLDAVIDSHKYNAEGRAIIFGEPDFVYSVTRLCCENGVIPVLTATGSYCEKLSKLLAGEIQAVASKVFVDEYKILDNTDFDVIESEGVRLGANIMIGNSDGRRIEEKQGISLIRCAFPVHDQIGGQRVRTLGYEGSLSLLDSITNRILFKKEFNFREALYNKYYMGNRTKYIIKPKAKSFKDKAMERNITHPCFNGCTAKNARMHLPVAPKCNISCNYCLRKFDCPNESRPGVTTEVLSPEAALEKYKIVKEKVPHLSVVGIAGPGDALADWENTKKTLSLIREFDPDVTFCVSTNGLMLSVYADELISLGVTHVTVTCNAVDPAVGAKIYRYVKYMGVRYEGESAAAILMANQLAGIKMLCEKGVVCKVNIVMLKGVNDTHVESVVKKVKEIGCFITNIMPLIPVAGSVFEDMPLTNNKELMELRKKCGVHLQQMYHCKQCRADAIGSLDNDISIDFRDCCGNKKNKESIRFAAISKSGILIDQHFGHATDVYIYEYADGDAKYIEKRNFEKYCDGQEECDEKDDKFESILNTIKDCKALICMRIGDQPSKKLSKHGINVITTYDRIESAIKKAAPDLILRGVKQ